MLTFEERQLLAEHEMPLWDGDDSIREDGWGQAALETVFTAGIMGIANGARAGARAGLGDDVLSNASRAGMRQVAAKSADEVTEGIYVITTSTGQVYVGQSANITGRLMQHVARLKIDKVEAELAKRIEVLGGKLNRELAEQLMINSKDGVKNLENVRNPIGPARQHLLDELETLDDLFVQLRANGTM